MIVEFVGAPAAGKSTLAVEVLKRLKAADQAVSLINASGNFRRNGTPRSSAEVYVDRLVSPLRRPKLSLWCLANVRSKEKFSRLLSLCRRAHAVDQVRRRPGVRLIDEGPFRQACTLLTRYQLSSSESVFERIPLPDLVVVVTIDPQMALERLRGRAEQSVAFYRTDKEVIDFVSRNQDFTLDTVERLGVPAMISPSAESVTDRLCQYSEMSDELGDP